MRVMDNWDRAGTARAENGVKFGRIQTKIQNAESNLDVILPTVKKDGRKRACKDIPEPDILQVTGSRGITISTTTTTHK